MGKITLNEALKKASVKNDLQMFLGLDAQSELGGMTPERLAAVAGGLKIMGVANQDADNNMTSGFFIVNLYVTSNINYPQKDAFALLSVFNIRISECVFQHLYCANGELYIRLFSNQKWSEWKKVGA